MAHSHQHVTLAELHAINPYYSRLLRTKISDEGAGLEEPCVASIKQNKHLLTNFPLNRKQSTNKLKKKKSLTCHNQVGNELVVMAKGKAQDTHMYLTFLSSL